MPLYRGWKFVKCQIERFKKKKKKVYITILLFTGTLRLSLNTKMFYLNIFKKEMVWILLLVHITLHGMIGGLLKHFPKAVCGIISICKNVSDCQKKKAACLFYLSLNASVTFTHTTSTSPI